MRSFLLTACVALALSAAGCREPQFLAAGLNGFTCRSADGTQWRQGRCGTDRLSGIAYGSGMYMATTLQSPVSSSRSWIFSTSDGIGWSMQVMDTEHEFIGIAYGGGKFVVLSPRGPILSYDDQTYWHDISYDIGSAAGPKISYAAGYFLIATDMGIYYATPGSLNDWQYVRVVPENQTMAFLSAVAGDDTTLIVADAIGEVYYAPADNFFSSSSWKKINLGLPGIHTTTVTYGNYQGADIFILSSGGVLKKSIDEGRTWQDVTPENFTAEPTSGVFQDGQFLLCAPDSGIWRSADGGGTWEQVFTSGPFSKPLAIAASTGE